MKKLLLFAALAAAATTLNAADTVTLDLTKAVGAPLQFDADNGAWTGTYDDDAEVIESQCFIFTHSSMADYDTWWGFTASNSADNARKEDTMKYQYSNMNAGGIVLDESGNVKLDEWGQPEVSKDVPYIVAYYKAYMAKRPCSIIFNDGKAHETQSMYVNLSSYPYYVLEYGNPFGRAFHNGDKFTLTIHGVHEDETEAEVTVDLCSYANGNLTINRSWSLVDLTPLGAVNELYFTMDSSDTGNWGMNTPGYFCLSGLTVKSAGLSAATAPEAETLRYDRASKTLTVADDFVMIYDASGRKVMACEGGSVSVDGLSGGVYVARTAKSSLKFAR